MNFKVNGNYCVIWGECSFST